MSLTLITGLPGCGKRERILGLFHDALTGGGTPALVLPNASDVNLVARSLADVGSFGGRVLVMDDLVRELWLRAGDGRALVTRSDRELLLVAAAREVGPEAARLVRIAGRIVGRLSEEVGLDWRSPRADATCPNDALTELLARYAEALTQAECLELGEAAHALSANDYTGTTPLMLAGFDDLTAMQRAVVNRARAAGEVYVTLPWAEGAPGTEALTTLVRDLSADATHIELASATGAGRQLSVLVDNIFQSSGHARNASVEFVEVDGEEAEAEVIAEAIRCAVQEGDPLGDVGVVFRNPSAHMVHLSDKLRSLGVEAEYDLPTPLSATSFGSAALALIEYVHSRNPERLFALVRSAYSGTDEEDVARFEAVVKRNPDDDHGGEIPRLKRLSSSLHLLVTSVGEGSSDELTVPAVRRWRRALGELLANRWGRQAPSQDSQLRQDGLAFELIMNSFEAPLRLGPGATLGDVLGRLREASIASSGIGRRDRVQVMSVARARSRAFRTLIVGGLIGGEFPARPDEALSNDGAAARHLTSRGCTAEDPRAHLLRERLSYFQILASAERKVVLCRQRCNSSGVELPTSTFWEEALDVFRNDQDDSPEWVGSRSMAAVISQDSPHDATEREPQFMCRADNPLGGEWSDVLLGDRVFTASEIEAYLACPHRWFLERVVVRSKADRDHERRDTGIRIHSFLESVYRLIMRMPEQRVTEANLETCLGLVDEVLKERLAAAGGRHRLSESEDWILAANATRATLAKDAKRLEGFKPTRLEWAFGLDDASPVVDMGGYLLRGFVDRIDVSDRGLACVIDYKFGEVSSRAADKLIDGGYVQGALYAEVNRRQTGQQIAGFGYLRAKDGTLRGIFDVAHVSGTGLSKGDLVGHEHLEEHVRLALESAADAVQRMRAGDIGAAPLQSTRCGSCSCSSTCEARRA